MPGHQSYVSAVEIRRRLAAANSAAYLPDLAMSLSNLSGCQSAAGYRDGALGSIIEAVEIRRRLAAGNPAAYLPDLAMSLNNLSNRQSETGDRDGALGSIIEAVEHYRRLAAGHPAAYLPDLAMSLNNLADRLDEVGDRAGVESAWLAAIQSFWRPAARAELRAAWASRLHRLGETDRVLHAVCLAVEEADQPVSDNGSPERSAVVLVMRARNAVLGRGRDAVQRFCCRFSRPRPPNPACGLSPHRALHVSRWIS